ncbi:tRNA (adenosine(37)-N6)-threonylcarbamoyltransferase complex dimerization subunit type 1 TsaB [Oceanobacillus halotolerans]|uniref:tRNA (adenosine(37)-N6)-threonylcarbamoyltransferase complex dimerization subunit type 1 TsaB n=1 Tax=Oceanobacillus halotolerans TaxID=2663380 RepID=UPI0013D9B00E|nr:tRNA (adenosine(37)-N6)-threonylcarbamoyltransferase complex dimerization subunit type 1 TsaB [Oceanobacillus halotolerans]
MNILAIDTSTQVLGVALLHDDKVVGEVMTNSKKNHSIRLMPAIHQLMEESNMNPNQLDRIVVAKGPGSYTGVRIGLSTAKTMAWALNIPVVGVSSLEVLAYQGRYFDGYICPYFDARRNLVYTGLYQWKENKLDVVKNDINILLGDWLAPLKKEDKSIMFLSPDQQIHEEHIKEIIGERAIIPDPTFHIPRPAHLALAGTLKKADNTHELAPNYLRLAEAEAKWLKAQKDQQNHG